MKLELAVRRRSTPQDERALRTLALAAVDLTGGVALVACGEITLDCKATEVRPALARLRRLGFEQLLDVDIRPMRDDVLVVYHLLSISRGARLRVRVRLGEQVLPEVADIYASALGLETLAVALWRVETGQARRPDAGAAR